MVTKTDKIVVIDIIYKILGILASRIKTPRINKMASLAILQDMSGNIWMQFVQPLGQDTWNSCRKNRNLTPVINKTPRLSILRDLSVNNWMQYFRADELVQDDPFNSHPGIQTSVPLTTFYGKTRENKCWMSWKHE